MAALTEPNHAMEFLVSDQGPICYEQGVVASGQNLDAGEVVMLSAGKLVAWTGATSATVVGILCYPVDATGGDKPASFLARLAEVRAATLTYPAGTLTLVDNDLAALNIILR